MDFLKKHQPGEASTSRANHENSQNHLSLQPSCSRKRRRRESVSSIESIDDDSVDLSSPPAKENRRRQRRALEPAEEESIEGFLSMMRGQIRACIHPDDHIKFFQQNLSLIAEFKKVLDVKAEQLPKTPVTLEQLRGSLAMNSTVAGDATRKTTRTEVTRAWNGYPGAFFSQLAVVTQPIMYLGLEADGKPLGRVRIRISCGPRRQQQILGLCDLFKGLCFGQARKVGVAGEAVSLSWKKEKPKWDNKAKEVPKINDVERIEKYLKRNVTIESVGTCLTLCTRTHPVSELGVKIGYIDHGVELLRKVLGKYTTAALNEAGEVTHYDASRIKIAETGIFYDTFVE